VQFKVVKHLETQEQRLAQAMVSPQCKQAEQLAGVSTAPAMRAVVVDSLVKVDPKI
jgi:hypothetical protein